MKRIALMVIAALCFAASIASAADSLARQFASPPDSAKPWVYWFWLDGNITREGITADLESMHRTGIGGVLIMEVDQGAPKGPARFGGTEWRELYKFMLSEAKRLGIEVNMSNDAGWCGSGGPWITPELAQKKIVWTETDLAGPTHFEAALTQPPTVANYYRDIAVFAVPTPAGDSDPAQRLRIEKIEAKAAFTPEHVALRANWPAVPADKTIPRNKIIDLTAKLDSQGHLVWEVPEGRWTVLRMGYTPTGKDNHPAPLEGRGLECDKLIKEGADAMFAGLMAKLISDSKPLVPGTLVSTHIDSWEVGSQNWSRTFREEFQKRRGYDPLPMLPAMTGRVVDSLEVSERFLWDVRQTVSELVVENYAGRFRELAHQHGLRLSIEAYDGCPCDEMTYAGQADEPMAEFWSWPDNFTAYSCTEMASSAHVYGKRILGAEAFTATDGEKWQHHPASIKALGDWAFCEGINRFVFHRYALQPWTNRAPGMSMGPWGLHYERTQTWWEDSTAWHQYLTRCQYLLQQGLFVADVCCLEPEGSPMRFSPPSNVRKGSDRPGYNFDGCTPEVVFNRMTVRDGKLVLPDGMSYRVMVLPEVETMTPRLLSRIKELVGEGATVIGAPPTKSPSLANFPQCDADLKNLTKELWGNCDGKTVTEHAFGKGRVVWGKTPAEVLAATGVPPDFGSDHFLRYIHRTIGDAEVYFVANKNPAACEALCTLRVSNKIPEFWWPESGKVERAVAYEQLGNSVRLPIRLDASGSVFVVFRENDRKSDPIASVSRNGRPVLNMNRAESKIVIQKAVYGVLGDPAKTRDVKAKVQQKVDRGEFTFQVAQMAEGDDPAFGTVKTLVIDYLADGQTSQVSGQDPQQVTILAFAPSEPVAKLQYGTRGRTQLEVWQSGRFDVTHVSGRSSQREVTVPQPIILDGSWDVHFNAGLGAPELVKFDKLISWSERPEAGIRYYSGHALYCKTMVVPKSLLAGDRRLYLDLGKVQVMARVKVNGHDLGVLWKAPYRIDVTDAVRAGENSLEITVVNLWINRQIGDETLAEDCQRNPDGTLKEWPQWVQDNKPSPTGRFTFTSWKLWKEKDPLVESGLIGPVTLHTTEVVTVK